MLRQYLWVCFKGFWLYLGCSKCVGIVKAIHLKPHHKSFTVQKQTFIKKKALNWWELPECKLSLDTTSRAFLVADGHKLAAGQTLGCPNHPALPGRPRPSAALPQNPFGGPQIQHLSTWSRESKLTHYITTGRETQDFFCHYSDFSLRHVLQLVYLTWWCK